LVTLKDRRALLLVPVSIRATPLVRVGVQVAVLLLVLALVLVLVIALDREILTKELLKDAVEAKAMQRERDLVV
jgi:hypothetical protein